MIESVTRCPQCGTENEAHQLFCSRCAAELVPGAAGEVEPPRARGRTTRRLARVGSGLHQRWDNFFYRLSRLAPGATEMIRSARQALLVMASLLPGLGHLLVGHRREGIWLSAFFLVAAGVWFGLIGTLTGGIAAFCALSLTGSSVLDILRMDPEGRGRRLPVRGRHVLMAVAIIAGTYAAVIWVASLVWQRVTINQPILRLAPGIASRDIAFDRGDRVLVSRGAYRSEDPSRGDVALARIDGMLSLQRVIAVPGDVVELKAGRLYLNSAELPQSAYPLQPENPVELRGGRLTRRECSMLVRPGQLVGWGVEDRGDDVGTGPRLIAKDNIQGKAWLVYSPYHNRRIIDHLDPVLRRGGDDGTAGD